MAVDLYTGHGSPYGWRVWLALELKKVAHEVKILSFQAGDTRKPEFVALNPRHTVPTIVDDGHVVWESLAILEYLDERWPEPPILPRDPFLRARARALAEIINAGIQPLQNLSTSRRVKALGGDETEWIRPVIADGLGAFAKLASEVSGTFCVGDFPTIADCCLVPQLVAARRFHVALEPLERLLAIEAHCLALPAFADAMPHHQPDAVKS